MPVSSATSSVVFSSLCKVDVYNERGKIGRTEMIVPDSSNHFVSKIYVPYGSTKMVIYFKNDKTSEFEVYKSFELNQLKMLMAVHFRQYNVVLLNGERHV